MKRSVRPFSVKQLYSFRASIGFPEYQREKELWSDEKKSLLIDSILRDIDIPKLYFNEVRRDTFEVIDGQQRLWAVWNFLDNKFPYVAGTDRTYFRDLATKQQRQITDYELQVVVFQNADDDYLRLLFLRLQFGMLLNTGEKLHAAKGKMKDFVFAEAAKHKFIAGVGIPKRRYARETLTAQVAINAFSRLKNGTFARTRYDDLLYFFEEYVDPRGKVADLFAKGTEQIVRTFVGLSNAFGTSADSLRNRSYILSLYLVFEEKYASNENISVDDGRHFAKFIALLWRRLKEESALGLKRKNVPLYEFQSLLGSAPGEKYQIERRHQKLIEFLDHYNRTQKILGD